jgi:hypothetical protein
MAMLGTNRPAGTLLPNVMMHNTYLHKAASRSQAMAVARGVDRVSSVSSGLPLNNHERHKHNSHTITSTDGRQCIRRTMFPIDDWHFVCSECVYAPMCSSKIHRVYGFQKLSALVSVINTATSMIG